jgi:hypothetical protein
MKLDLLTLGNDSDAAPCGAQNPDRKNVTSSSSTAAAASASATSSGGSDTFGGSGSGGAATTSSGSSGTKQSSASMIAINLGQTYGLAVVISGIFAGFALLA